MCAEYFAIHPLLCLFKFSKVKNHLDQFSILTVIIFGTIGNALSLSVILFYRRLRLRPFNIIIMFLIVEDLISCSIAAPVILTLTLVYVRTITVNHSICLTSLFLNNLSKFGSLLTMSEIAILRVINLSYQVCAKKFMSKTSMTILITFMFVRFLFRRWCERNRVGVL